ncbi:MAG: hypothetical protein HRF43_18170 [Phycisphaerae bacterium]|jgi:hypothetical protein
MTHSAPPTDRERFAQQALLVVLVLAGLAGACAAWAWWGTGDLKSTLMCSAGCGYIRAGTLSAGDMLPATCPRCGRNSLVPAFHCPKCRSVNVWNESRGLPPPTRCGKCGQEVWHEK